MDGYIARKPMVRQNHHHKRGWWRQGVYLIVGHGRRVWGTDMAVKGTPLVTRTAK